MLTQLYTWNYHITLANICIHCVFSISYLSIPWIVAHERCIIPTFLLFLFNFNAQCRAVPFIYVTVFSEDLKWDSMSRGGRGMGSQLFVLRLACLISVNVFRLLFSWCLIIGVYYNRYQYYHYHYHHYYCFIIFLYIQSIQLCNN